MAHGGLMRWSLLSLMISACSEADVIPDDPQNVEPFTLVAIPDIQYMTLGQSPVFEGMTSFIREQSAARNVRFVMQEGDISHNNTDAEFAFALDGFDVLRDTVDYAVCVGNHDMDGRETSVFNRHFGDSYYVRQDSYDSQRQVDKVDDHVHTFEVDGVKWLVLSLVYDPQPDTIAWADGVLLAHPEHRTIVLTHAYLLPNGARSSIGDRIWDGVVAHHPQVTMVLNGHYTAGEAARQVSVGDAGNAVHELFVNFQDRPLGGMGLARFMEIDPAAGTISVQTLFTLSTGELDDEANLFVLDDVELGAL
ncbi:MAG: hypothetical protein ACI9MC_003443 [Kiritimatiellia bacterium]|jgi:hypothetical protein